MKSTLGKSVAEHIISENQKLKDQLIHIKRDLKKIQDKMMQALDKLSVTYSSRLKGCQKLLLFDSPYQCLAAFVQQMGKTATFSILTADQNQSLVSQNRKLQYRIQTVQTQLRQRKLKQEETIDSLNKQIQTKKLQLKKLQQDYQNVLKAKRVAEKELTDTKEHMKILRLKLYQEQREKLTEIIVANKKEMIDFRRSMQMQAYKQQLQYKKNMQQKQIQIRTLTQNIQELINNNLTHLSDLTVLQKIVQPMRDHTNLKGEIMQLKKEVVEMRQEIRDKQGMILGLEGKVADATMARDNLVSYNQRLVIEKNLLTQQLKQTKEQLQKAINDRQALDLYYSEKWHTQFSKVKSNLQQKFTKKNQQLQIQFSRKRKQVQAQILGHVERLRVMKGELGEVRKRNQELVGVNVKAAAEMNLMKQKNVQLQRVIKQADMLHNEQLRVVANKLGERIILLSQTNDQLTSTNRSLQFQLSKALSQIKICQQTFLRQKFQQIQQINFQHRRQLQKQKKQHKRQIQLLQRSYGNMKEVIEEARLDEKRKFEMKQKQLIQTQTQKLKQVHAQCQTKIKKINQKLSQSQNRYQKLRRVKQQEQQCINKKITQSQNILHQRQKELISRDVQLEEYKKMRETYMGEIARLNSLLNEEVFLRQSVKVELETTMKRVEEKQKIIQQLQGKKHKFNQQLLQFQKIYKKQFAQLQQNHKKQTAINKRKIKQLQLMFEQRPIKQQHFQKIKSLQKTNSQLRTEIHLKQAQNVILNEVKEYYQNRAFYLTGNKNNGSNNCTTIKNQVMQNATKQQLSSTCTFMKTYNSFMRPGTNHGGSSIVKKYRNRKNKLITSSYNKFDAFQEQKKEGKQDSNEIIRMRRYLMKQHGRGNGMVSEFKRGQQVHGHERTKSSIG